MTQTFPEETFVFEAQRPPAGDPDRFTRRWTLTGAGLANVWRYGDLDLVAPSGRMLLRGANGTGKTTALEALCPYLLDLNAKRLAAGKARPTTLSLLMAEGARGKRRTGYAWLTFSGPADPDQPGEQSWGARLQYGPNSTPKVKVVPFTIPGRPLRDHDLYGVGRAALTAEEFTAAVTEAGGRVFDSNEDYVEHLAATVWQAGPAQLEELTGRMREVRNPSLLGEVTPANAADALRSSLPTVNATVLAATADALAESDATRDAFGRDRDAAATLADFADKWTGHVVDVVTAALDRARTAHGHLQGARTDLKHKETSAAAAVKADTAAAAAADRAREDLTRATARVKELESSTEYQAAKDLGALREQARSRRSEAARSLRELTTAAASVATTGAGLCRDLDDLAATINDLGPAPTAGGQGGLLAWSSRPRAVVRVGDRSIDAGPGIQVATTVGDLIAVADSWSTKAHDLLATADRAQLAVSDYRRQVAAAETRAEAAARRAETAREKQETALQAAHRATSKAHAHRDTLLEALGGWEPGHDALSGAVDRGDVDGLAGTEPGQVLLETDTWHDRVQDLALTHASQSRADATLARDTATDLEAQAGGLRTDAAALRSGKLLPLPRPSWARPSDAVLVGDVVAWAPGFDDPDARACVEVALADSGLLGAAVTETGTAAAADGTWTIDLTAPAAEENLTAVLDVDPTGIDAAVVDRVRAVLARVTYAPSSGTGTGAGLVVGRDGSFATGPLAGTRAVAGAAPAASFVGARARRAAALVEAARLEEDAARLDADADGHRGRVQAYDLDVRAVTAAARTFPSRTGLRDAEAGRVLAAGAAIDATRDADAAAATSLEASDAATAAAAAWSHRCRDLGLPADVPDLKTLVETSRRDGTQLSGHAALLRGRVATRLGHLLTTTASAEAAYGNLAELRADAAATHDAATAADEQVATATEVAGESAEAVVRKLGEARTAERALAAALPKADNTRLHTHGEVTRTEAERVHAEEEVGRAVPAADETTARLRHLVCAPGVTQALTRPDDTTAVQVDLATAVPVDLFAAVASLVAGRPKTARLQLQTSYDTTRQTLAGVWSLDPADPVEDLQSYVLTHNEETYTPAAAATQAATLAARAEQALAAAEDSALRDFIIGKLPAAIGIAWSELLDWKRVVNAKMKDASASSGVGVQVDIHAAPDMPPAVKTVYDLAYKVANADRTADQQREVGAAIRALIDAADGDTMLEKVTAAVDVRDWADVSYVVTRPGEDPKRWTSRTGLSGGERRLVVLAPMLAAIAAGYDAMDPGGARLVALDEVPAEVDEAGREGLARYIAELDLDLLCTSYLWDGAPGAWDGLDAWDFEAGGDGVVVAFPMLIRGLDGMPGDETWDPATHTGDAGDGDGLSGS